MMNEKQINGFGLYKATIIDVYLPNSAGAALWNPLFLFEIWTKLMTLMFSSTEIKHPVTLDQGLYCFHMVWNKTSFISQVIVRIRTFKYVTYYFWL